MATAIGHLQEPIECGYCMEQGDQLVDPRSLPCQHVHCYPCLAGDFETNRIVRCGKCKAVFDVTLARLPVCTRREDNLPVCDICVHKGITDELAATYCTDCNKRICTKHLQFHEEFFPDHEELLKIEEYQRNSKLHDIRNCTKHETKPVTMGCSFCYQVLCTRCMDGTKECDGGVVHQPLFLEELVNLLKVKKDKVKSEAQIKEGELSAVLKRSTKILSDFERKTEELIERLHKVRNEQLLELGRKYEDLERELLDNRRRSKEQLVEFMEREVGFRMTEINTLVLLQDARFKDAHQVDIVESFAATANQIKRFVKEDLPSFKLTNQRTLFTQARVRGIELKIGTAADIPFWPHTSPTSLRLDNVVNYVEKCSSVCHYGEFTYVSCKASTVYKIDKHDSIVAVLPSLEGTERIHGLCVYNERLYILAYPGKVVVTDLNGKLITSWVHPDKSEFINKLVVTGDKVVVPERPNNRLVVYSLDGQVINRIPCPQDGERRPVALCAPDQESIVVSSSGTSTVFRVNIETGEMMWTSTAVAKPGGVASYTEEYILVTPLVSDCTEIHVLHADTGNHIRKLMSQEKCRSFTFELCVEGDTVLVPSIFRRPLMRYQLISEW